MQLKHDPIGGWNQLREMAGLLLKNALTNPPVFESSGRMRLLPHASEEIKKILCGTLKDSNAGVRRVGSSIISSCCVGISSRHGTMPIAGAVADGMEALPLQENKWGEGILTPFLVSCLEAAIGMIQQSQAQSQAIPPDVFQFALLGSLQTLVKLLEDDAEKFERGSGAAFNKIVPSLLRLLQICGETRVKVDCLKCCVNMIRVMPGSLVAQMNDFLGVLSSLAGDESVEVRKYVCRSIVTL